MELRIKVNPVTHTNPGYTRYYRSRDDILSSITYHLCQSYSKHSDGAYTPVLNSKRSIGQVAGIHLEKRRKKVARVLITKGSKKGKYKSEIIHPAHWVGKVYYFDEALLKAANVKIVQHARHFDIVPL